MCGPRRRTTRPARRAGAPGARARRRAAARARPPRSSATESVKRRDRARTRDRGPVVEADLDRDRAGAATAGPQALAELVRHADERLLERIAGLTRRPGRSPRSSATWRSAPARPGLESWKCARARSSRRRALAETLGEQLGRGRLELTDGVQAEPGEALRRLRADPVEEAHRVGGEVRDRLLAAHRDERGRLEGRAGRLRDQPRGPDPDRQRHRRALRHRLRRSGAAARPGTARR